MKARQTHPTKRPRAIQTAPWRLQPPRPYLAPTKTSKRPYPTRTMPKSGPTQKCTLIDPCDPKATHLAAIQSHQTNGFINNKKALEGKGAIWKREINLRDWLYNRNCNLLVCPTQQAPNPLKTSRRAVSSPACFYLPVWLNRESYFLRRAA